MKTVKKILEYQATILRLLSHKSYDIFELENVCLCRIGHIACFESFMHALKDLVSNGKIKRFQNTLTKGA